MDSGSHSAMCFRCFRWTHNTSSRNNAAITIQAVDDILLVYRCGVNTKLNFFHRNGPKAAPQALFGSFFQQTET